MSDSLFARAVRRLRRIISEPRPKKFPWSEAVEEALRQPTPLALLPAEDAELASLVRRACARERPDSRSLFFQDGAPLACWREEDVGLDGDWLTSPNYYPLYHALLQEAVGTRSNVRLLEIGVRTGYLGVVFARATEGAAVYCGVDPNIYLHNGLRLADQALAAMRAMRPAFSYELIKGYSHDERIRRRLRSVEKFGYIHIDGDHSLEGKLADLELSRSLLKPGGLVLVDDYHHMPAVPEAIQRAFALGWYRRFAVGPTVRGLAVLS